MKRGLAIALLLAAALPADAAVAPHASWTKLSASNGLSPIVYDASRARLVSLRERVYAQVSSGELTRELMYDLYFGLRAGGSNVWLGEAAVDDARYVDGTGVIRVEQRHGDLVATQWFFAPYTVPLRGAVAVIEVRNDGAAPLADAAVFSLHNLHVGSGGSGTGGESIVWSGGAFEERGEGSRLVLHQPFPAPSRHMATPQNPYLAVSGGGRMSDVDSSGVTDDAVAGFEWDLAGLAPGETRRFGVAIGVAPDGSRASIPSIAADLLEAELADWQAFQARATAPAGLTPDERAAFRTAVAMLRMGQVRETGAPHGQIVASLPPGIWNRTWVRDQTYAVRALVALGLYDEARAAFSFLFDAAAGDYASYVGEPYALSVCRYYGDGVEESDWNERGPNIELDGFGLTLGALAEYVLASGDDTIVTQYEAQIFALTADVLLRRIDGATGLVMADSSIWETHWDDGGRKHFTYTQAAAVWGLRGAALLAERTGRDGATYAAAADALAVAIESELVGEDGVLRGNAEEIDTWLDAAAVEAFNWDVLPADGAVAAATLDAFKDTLWLGFTGHGYRRNDDGGEYDEREWLVVDLRIALALRRAGRDAEADALIAWITDQAAENDHVIPENYHPLTADYAGEVPMIGFGAGAYVTALFERGAPASMEPDAGVDVADAGALAPDATAGATTDAAGCGCATTRSSPTPWGALLVLGVLFLRRRLAPLAVAALLLSGCGLESLFGGGDYDATPRPRVIVEYTAPGGTERVEAYDANDRFLGATTQSPLDLGDAADHANLRVVAIGGDVVLARALVPDAARSDEPIAVVLDGDATAAALLVEARVAGDGMTLGSTPAPVTKAMLALAAGDDGALVAFRALVAALAPDAAFATLGAALRDDFRAARPDDAAAYDEALAAALPLVSVPIVCDPAFVRVMFTVDVSGQALDGNGARQLIRQPPKEGRVFLGFTVDDSSPIGDAAGLLPTKLTPNDPSYAMLDDGTGGDELAADGVYTVVVTLPRGMRIIYKYTDGSAGEPFTRTEEWPGNARILQIDDVVTRHADGRADCLVIRRDSFGDEASNKNFTSLAEGLRDAGGALGWDVDLGGMAATPLGDGRVSGGLGVHDARSFAPLTPAGVAEARENGVCTTCPAPLVLALDDSVAPVLLGASFLSTTDVEVRFSEAMDFAAASDPSAYLIVDEALRPLPIRAVAAVGDRVRLRVEGPDFAASYTLHVRCLPDASAARNPLECDSSGMAQTAIGEDVTAPRPVLARAGSRKDYDAGAILADPTVGEVIHLTFTEELDPSSAQDVGRYRVRSVLGETLPVRGAFLVAPSRVLLVTDPQVKRQKYTVDVISVRDFAGNASAPTEPLPFDGFALYRMTFGVVPGHAFVTRDGSVRGIPRNERLYVTGTPLAVARDPGDGTDLSIPGRTDVTGVPEMELLPTSETHAGEPVYRLTLLVPPGLYAWKAAHGVPGEWVDPPTTLEKVTKSLGTTNDARGVNIDPVTLVGRDGIDYAGAVISLDGTDTPSTEIIFKRENPDEICEVEDQDVDCPTIVVGTWRDLDEFIAGGILQDYDDGEPEVPPTRLVADTEPPAPILVQVRDSESLRITFDEGIAAGSTVQVSIAGLEVVEVQTRFPGPHELVVRTAPQAPSTSYQLAISGLTDLAGNTHGAADPLVIGWTSPSVLTPFTPFEDDDPPILVGVTPESPTSLRVQFNEAVAPGAADPAKFAITPRGGDPAPAITGATLAGGGKVVVLTTTTQPLMGELTLHAADIADTASPPNVLAGASFDFVGFGDLTPPVLESARAISTTSIVLVFDESLDAATAMAAGSYTVAGATVTGVEFSGDPSRLSTAFDPADARLVGNVVLLTTTPMAAGSAHAVTANVRDLSGNLGGGMGSVTAVAAPPTVDVYLEVRISDTTTVAGGVPARAISPARLDAEREGVFIVGIGGFPPEGSPLNGVEPQLVDDGTGGDLVAGDDIYTIRVEDVPLGSVLEWKAFAPYTVAWKNSHPSDAAAAFADALPGPSAFSDGQEYPGNENGILVLGAPAGGIRIKTLFGDETTFKKLTMTDPFVWAVEDLTYAP